jgi:NAD(P)H-hydrate epimerase
LSNSHKGDYGKALIIGGSYGKIGAVTLSARAAIKSGAGLVTALLPGAGYQVIQTAVPEVMCKTNGEKVILKIDDWEDSNAIGIGPGLGTDNKTVHAFVEFIDACKQPLVVDADALNILAKHPDLLGKLPKESILTPHPKEFSRLFGENTNSMIQVDNARIQAMRYGFIIVLKNHHTAVITPEGECWYNMTGNAGMATGGTGDVLTGIITGLLAQKYTPLQAALFGVYIHGFAGDLAAKELSQEAMVAGDIINYLGKGFLMM